MDGKLLIRLKPEPEESLLGLLLRTAEANGYPDLNWIAQLAGARSTNAFDPGPAAAIAELLDLPEEEIAAHFYRPSMAAVAKGQVDFKGKPIHRSMIDVRHAKLCPVCLAERAYLRAAWDLTLLPVCPGHGVGLIGACPHCARPLSWRRPSVTACTCGFDLRAAPVAGISAAVKLLARAITAFAPTAIMVELPVGFLQLPMGEALDLTLFLGAHRIGRGAGRGRRLAPRLKLNDAVAIFDAAAQVLTEWPKNFYLMLDDIRRHAAAVSTRSGLQGEFRSFYAALYSKTQGGSRGSEFVRRTFESYVENHWDGGFVSRKNTRLGDTAYADRRYITRAETMKLLHVRGPVVDRLIEHKRLVAAHRRMRRRTLTLIDRRSVDAFQLRAAELVGMGEAKSILGLSKAPVLDLAAQGYLSAERGPRVDGSSTWMFSRPALHQFVHTVLGPPPFEASAAGIEERCGFEGALRRLSWHGLDAVALVKEILAGHLKVADHDRSQVGLRIAQFYRSDLDLLIERHRPPKSDWVSLTKAARELGLKEQVTYQLAQRSLLRTWPVMRDGKPQLGVPRGAVDEFRKTYVAASDLAAKHHTSARHIVLLLQRSGVRPVTGPTIDQSRQYFFHRARLGMPDAAQALDQLA